MNSIDKRLIMPAVMLLAALVVLALFVFAIHWPVKASINDMEANIADKRNSIAALESYLNQHGTPDYEKKLQVKIKALAVSLPESSDSSQLVADLQKLALTCGINILSITPQPEQQGKDVKQLPFKLEIEGNYFSLLAFLRNIEQGKRYANVSGLKLKSQSGWLKVQLFINYYVYT